MNIEGIINRPQVLRRIRFYLNGVISGTIGMTTAYRASHVFRQKVVASHRPPESWGFEVETLRHPKEAQLALRATGAPLMRYEVLWKRPARPGEGEGPRVGHHRPAGNGRPAGPF